MSNCIRLKNPDEPIGVIPFNQDVMDRIKNYNPRKNCWDNPADDPLRWIDVFFCDGGQYERGSKPDRILFYIGFTTHREMRWFRREIVNLGGWLMEFRFTDEYDGHKAVGKYPHYIDQYG